MRNTNSILYKSIQEYFRAIAVAHGMVNQFKMGEEWDKTVDENKYPLLYLDITEQDMVKTSSNRGFVELNYNITLYCFDKVMKDGGNMQQVYNDTLYVLNTIIDYIETSQYSKELSIKIEDRVPSVKCAHKEVDDLNGWMTRFILRVPSNFNLCNSPIEPFDFSVPNSIGIDRFRLIGPQGFQGSGGQGVQGVEGVQGSTGSTGPQGPQGFQGDTGSNGSTGTQGPQGKNGANGEQGNQGIQGPQGFQGNQGFQGLIGSNGTQGPQGNIGTIGSTFSIISFTGGTQSSSTLSLQNLIGSEFTVDVGVYDVRYYILYNVPATTTGIRLAINGTAGQNYCVGNQTYATLASNNSTAMFSGYDVGMTSPSSVTTVGNSAGLDCRINVTSPGTITLRFNTEVNGSTLTVTTMNGSLLKLL